MLSMNIANEVPCHGKSVTALSVFPMGILSGSLDNEVCHLSPTFTLNYRLEPVSGSSVTNIAYNRSKDCFAVGTFDSSLPIFRQDGSKLCEFPRGDRYLYQLKHTKGHTGSITQVKWNQNNSEILFSASEDKTIRKFTTSNPKSHSDIFDCRRLAEGYPATFDLNENQLIAGFSSGELISFDSRASRVKSSIVKTFNPITNLQVGPCKSVVYSLSESECVLFDIRNFKKPIHSFEFFTSCKSIGFSEDGRSFIIAKTSPKMTEVNYIDCFSFATSNHYSLSRSVTVFELGNENNSLFFGDKLGNIGQLSNNPNIKQKLLTQPGRVDSIMSINPVPYHPEDERPNTLKAIPDKWNEVIQKWEARKARAPAPPIEGAGKDGRIGSSMKATLIGPYVKSRAVVQDIRDAILQHKINPETSVIDKAYQ
eukprot:TRINITY_DN1626_c0_g1_i5.p1 TRINITY_DN1626_c0_g1~~TRINITY_DN1626_c0_g1_i5.p1  ORF type:complete len:424 (+),score=20.91 TRINITY_DN1626_c0_g1_i5:84-1355(+)